MQLSNRGKEWLDFSSTVLEHVETYSVIQYGDAPNDEVEFWNVEDCLKQIVRYCKRHATNARANQRLLDLKKIAHYACLAYNKEMIDEDN